MGRPKGSKNKHKYVLPVVPFLERVVAKVQFGGLDECWLWKGVVNESGYGFIGAGRRGGAQVRATWAMWELHTGARPPKGSMLLHSCDNPGCVNPMHLSIGTAAQNSADMVARNRSTRGEKNPGAKLTKEKALEIIRRLDAGDKAMDIAADFGISRPTVSDIKYGRLWGWARPTAAPT